MGSTAVRQGMKPLFASCEQAIYEKDVAKRVFFCECHLFWNKGYTDEKDCLLVFILTVVKMHHQR